MLFFILTAILSRLNCVDAPRFISPPKTLPGWEIGSVGFTLTGNDSLCKVEFAFQGCPPWVNILGDGWGTVFVETACINNTDTFRMCVPVCHISIIKTKKTEHHNFGRWRRVSLKGKLGNVNDVGWPFIYMLLKFANHSTYWTFGEKTNGWKNHTKKYPK